MKTSLEGIELIKAHEMLMLEAYLDPVGIPTIGWGHTGTVDHDDVINRRTITETEALSLIRSDLKDTEKGVLRNVRVPLNQNQFNALISFVFNTGETNFSKSTLLKKLNRGQYDEVPFELSRWVFGTDQDTGEKVRLNGLVRRRADEGKVFITPVNSTPVPSQGANQTTMPNISTSPSPTPVRIERSRVRDSRTMKAGTVGAVAGVSAGAGKMTNSLSTFTEEMSVKVPWFDDAIAILIIGGVTVAVISVAVMMFCRWSDIKSALN